VQRLLAELTELFPSQPMVLARELTKRFQEFLRGTPAELAERTRLRPLKGEVVALIDNRPPPPTPAAPETAAG
jgi:16S rRNA (cytidine1402-2'-O)-methyltransferase